jgi:hypothetical protein
MSTTVLPKEATVGMAVSLSGTIANNGLASTGASFPYFFQIATAPNGGGTLSNLPSSTMNTLAVGASGVGTASHTFSSVGVYSVRICADQTTQGSGGVITESNEGNNCGAWTTFFVLRSPQNLSATCNSSTGMITISGDNYTTALSNSEVSAVHYPIRIHDTSTTWVDPTPCNGPFGGGNYCSDSNPSFPTTFQGVIGKSYFIWAHTKATFTNGRAEYWAQDTPSSTTVTCSATPQPDLVVTSLTGDGGAQATVGVSKRFLVGVSNTGTATTGSGFNTFVQINTQPDGSGAMYDGSYSNSGALTSGQSTTVDPTYTFSSAGTYYVRACTDAQNSSFVGNVAESNEGNNCGAWTAFTVTSNSCTAPWGATVANGASVTAYQTSSVVAPATCVSQTLTCTNGTLSGTYTNQTCVTTPSSSPDLTAGSVSPTSATAGASTALSATISNIGTASTGANFPYFFQVATAANGGGTVTSLSYVSAPISSLAAGATLQGTSNYTFSSAGTYSARLCVDMANGSLGYGAGAYWANITESNENNNCGAWTTITVTANTSCTAPWGATVANGASVTAYQTSSVTSPASCVSQTRTCTNGTLSGTYANQTCVVLMDTCPSGTTQDVVVTGATSGGIVYGTDIYTEDSSVNMAAVHAGILSVGQTATIRKNFGGNMSSYTGSTRNGVTSVSYGSQWCSMTLTNIGGGADVIAGSVTPVTATSDQSVTFSANVTNSGTLTTGISFPYFFQVATDAFGTGAVDLSSNTTSALVSGATRAVTRSYTFNLPSGGTRYVRMCADKTDRNDTTGSLVETNENNNCGAWTMVTVAPTPPANLTASTVTPTSLTTGTRNLSTTVSNIGLGDTQESIPVLIQVATSSNGGGTITNLSALAGWIDAGNATTFSRSYTFTTAGTYSARACADMTSFGSGGVETESNELDNCSAWTDIVVSPPPQPNLVSGVVTPSSAQAGNSTTFSVTISNTGNASTGASFSYFFQVASGADGSGTVTDLTSSTMSSISSGNSRTGTRAYTFASSGTYSMRACADKTNATNAGTITESNESDNCGTWTNITVLGAGCSAQTVTWGTSCTASIGAVADGAVISINDSTIPNTGSATYSCTNGTLTIQGGSSCVTPPAVTLISSPQTVTSGDTTTLTWTVSGSATACTIDNAIGSVSTTGGSVTTPQLSTTITHTLTCTNAGGSGTASYTTNVTPMPNLIAGSVSPVAVIAGDATTLSATISNTGTANTGASFPYFFQVASGADGSGIIINLAYSNMSTLSTSASAVASANHTFTSGGTLSVRVCADKQTPTHAGVITESNENDNCGVWTNVTVVAPSGDLTVSSNECLIQTGENSCQVTATWVTQNASSPILKNEYTGGTLSNALQMTTPFSLTVYADQSAPNDNTFSLKQGILDLDQETVTARCAFGGYDSISDTCVNPQIVSVTVHGEYYAVTGRLQVTCSNSDTYRVVLNGVTHQSGAYNGTTVNVPVNTTGDYSVYCGKGDYYTNPPRVVRYNASPPPSPDIVITATPSTLSRESDSMISWRIIHPRPGCTLTAKTVCQNNTCNSNQITHENTINQRIQTALVDSASANMLVSNVATMTDKPYIRNSFFFNTTSWANRANWEEEDWSVSAKAKFESFLYTTNFTLNCPSVQNSDGTFTEERERTVRVMVTSSGEQ